MPKDRFARVQCSNCNCVFEFTSGEGEYVSDQRDGDCIKIACPTCKIDIYISVKLFGAKENNNYTFKAKSVGKLNELNDPNKYLNPEDWYKKFA